MARVLYGGVGLQGLSGSINKQAGGHTFSKNNIVRRRVVPSNPQTAPQQLTRSVFSQLTSAWSSLTDAQRQLWEKARGETYYLKVDALTGTTRRYASAKDLFIAMNYNILEATDSLGIPSVVFSVPGASLFASDVLATDIAFNASAGTAALTFSGTKSANEELVLFCTPPVSPGNLRSASVRSKFRYLTQNISTSPSAQGTAYTTKFGAITADEGLKVFWELYTVTIATGVKKFAGGGASIIVT